MQALLPPPQLGTQVADKHSIEWLSELKKDLENDAWLKVNRTEVTHRNGLAWRGDWLYVPIVLRSKVLKHCHDVKTAGHFGFLKMLHLTRRQFWWPKMWTDIETYLRQCPVCAMSKPKPGKPFGLLQSVANPCKPWEEIAMDFIVELPNSRGHTMIWTVIDLFSKQAHFIPCKGLPSAQHLACLFVHHIYQLHGVPKCIISDRGVQFTVKFWRNFLCYIGSAQGLSSAFHPSTNGAVEWTNTMVECYLRAYVSYQQDNWCELLPFAETAYNNSVHRSTGFTPFKIVTGKDFPAIPELDGRRPSHPLTG